MLKQRAQNVSRRSFLKAGAAAAGSVAIGSMLGAGIGKTVSAATGGAGAGAELGADAKTEAAAKTATDSAKNNPSTLSYTRSTCGPNCTGGCGLVACVQDNEIKTIIQAADYPEEEMNPRGCLKGLSMNNLIHGPERLYAPMFRTGAPGKDEFEEVGWDEALDKAGSRLREIMDTYGPDSVGCMVQVAATGHVHKGALSRLASINGWTMHGGYDMNGDLPMSAPITFGVQSEELESYCWPDARYLMVFGSNLAATRIPDAHFLTEARQAGAKMVVFDPNYSVTASKADEYFSIDSSADAAVALGMAKVIIDEDLYDRDFVITYSDLPLLINTATNKKLTATEVADIEAPADIPEYRESYVVATDADVADGSPAAVDPTTLELSGSVELEGSFEVRLKDGTTASAKTAFTLLREQLKNYTPQQVEDESDMPADDLVRIAREAATTRPLHIIYGASNYQWYHGDLKGRALSLLPVLTGNIGNAGGGFSTYAGQYRMRFNCGAWWKFDGKGPAWMPFEYLVHGPTKTMTAPMPTNGIKAWIVYCGNPFDQHNLNNRLCEMVEEGDLELVINLDFQKTTTSLYSDILLPGVSWYEKTELVSSPVHQYLQLMQPAIKPLGQCKPELWIFRELARRVCPGTEKNFYDHLEPEAAAEEVIKLLLETGGTEVEGITLEHLREGPVKLRHSNPGDKRIPFYDQIHHKVPFPPQSFPEKIETTAQFVKSGRIEFYKDEDTFIKLGEALPVHKPPFEESEYALDPTIRDRYTFAYLSRNSIHRVHSTHSNNRTLLELQNEKPKAFINPTIAAEKNIEAGDEVEVYNDRGSVTGFAVLDPGIRSNVVIFEEGWWSAYTGNSYNTLIYPHIKPTHEVYFVPQMWSPNTNWNECLCDVRKAVG
ncbi:MAG: molybdopterin-dependent oxidoreductase [Coriobacteriales bacterium]|nr:molybdopterin-dependent oxidoreductase [Coriobacteriales bacterium]